jgi:hypothetical protein
MFETISYRKSPFDKYRFDLGLFAECLIFYNKVLLFADEGLIATVVKHIGLDNIEFLVKTGKVEIVFTPWHYGTRTFNGNTKNEYFDFCGLAKVPRKGSEPDVESLFFEALERGSQKKGKSRRVGRRLYTHIDIFESNNKDKSVPEIARKVLENKKYTQEAIETIIKYYAPSYPLDEKFYFHIERHANGFNIITNLNINEFNRLSNSYGNKNDNNQIGKAHIVDHLLKVELELFVSSYLDTEIIIDSIHSNLITLKCDDILKQISSNYKQVELFQSVVIDGAKIIRESINSGNLTFESIFPILDESEKYHKWTASIDNNSNLIREYYKEVTAQSLFDKLPSKAIRFILFTGAGLFIDAAYPTGLGTAAGISLSLGDTFLVDKIIKGWKPNQFIEKIEKIYE